MGVQVPAVSALERRLRVPEGSLDGADRALAEDSLSDAALIVGGLVAPALVASWATEPPPEGVEAVVLRVARRLYTNPDGYRMETLGDYSWSLGRDTGLLTEAEMTLLRRAVGTSGLAPGVGRGFVGSIRLG